MRQKTQHVVQVRGDLAMFTHPAHKSNKDSYPVPTPGALRGLIKSIYHKNHLEIVPTRVEILRPVRTNSLSGWRFRKMMQINVDGKSGDVTVDKADLEVGKGILPRGSVYLWDVEYRVHFDVYSTDSRDGRRLDKRIAAGAFDSPPYLGTSECLVTFGVPDDKPPLESLDLLVHDLTLSNRGYAKSVAVFRGVMEYPAPDTQMALRDRIRPWDEEKECLD